jgi:hypothetical protein
MRLRACTSRATETEGETWSEGFQEGSGKGIVFSRDVGQTVDLCALQTMQVSAGLGKPAAGKS